MKTFSEETRRRMSESAKRRAATKKFRDQIEGYWQPFCPREDLVRDYCESIMTQAEIAKKYGVTTKRVQTSMRRFEIAPRRTGKRYQQGEANSSWKGEDAGYSALHLRVIAAKGRPMECAHCGCTDPNIRYDWANLTGRYEDIDDYERLCACCHTSYDVERRRETGRRTMGRFA